MGVRVQEGLWLFEPMRTRWLMHGTPGDFVLLPSRYAGLVCRARTGALLSGSVSYGDAQHGQVTAGDQPVLMGALQRTLP